jgi:MFS family permease
MNNNIKIYYITGFLGALVFSTPIWTFFFTQYLWFSIGTAIFLTTLNGLMNFVFDIPTSAWADRYGRKKIYIVWLFTELVGISFYLWAHTIPLFILSTIITGFGSAIMSGNIEAMIHDYLEDIKKEWEYPKIQTNGYFFFFISRALACILWGFLFTIQPLLPYELTILCMITSLPLIFFFQESKQQLSSEKTNTSHILKALSYITKRKDILYVIIASTLLSSIWNIYWFTYQPYLQWIGYSISFIGISFAIASVFSAIGSLILKKLQWKGYKEIDILQYLIAWLFFASIWFYLSILNKSVFWILPIMLLSILSGFVMSIGNSYIVSNVPKTHKSTSLSIFSFSITFGYFLFSWWIGFLIVILSITNVYMGIFIFTLFLLPLNYFILRKIR